MSKFKFIDIFAGIGGFRRGLEFYGGECVFSSEIDKFASQAYEVMYADKPRGDITKIDAKDIPDHDILASGFPCQSFSVAGSRGGFEDARGTLFFEVARIADEKKPKIFLAENVKGLVGHDKGRTLDTIVKTLNDIGYRVDFDVLNSKYFGVPQNRERIFIVGIREDLVENDPWIIEGNTVVPKGKRRISGYDDVKTFNFDWPEQGEVSSRLRDILEPVVDEKYYLSEERTEKLVAQLEERSQVKAEPPTPLNLLSRGAESRGDGMAYALKAAEGGSSKQHLLEDSPQMIGHVDLKGHDAIKRVYSAEAVSPTLTTMGGEHREPKIAEEQAKLNIVGHSGSGGQKGHIYGTDGLMSTLTATDYKQPKQIAEQQEWRGAKETDQVEWEKEKHIRAEEVRPVLTPDRINKRQNGRRFKEDGEESFTLTAQDRHGVAEGTPPKYRIRKLTPLECFRLQGFPDSAHQALVDAGISDSQRYKMAGNAVTVNVIEAIGERLVKLLP